LGNIKLILPLPLPLLSLLSLPFLFLAAIQRGQESLQKWQTKFGCEWESVCWSINERESRESRGRERRERGAHILLDVENLLKTSVHFREFTRERERRTNNVLVLDHIFGTRSKNGNFISASESNENTTRRLRGGGGGYAGGWDEADINQAVHTPFRDDLRRGEVKDNDIVLLHSRRRRRRSRGHTYS
jgi:hypothetical protein